jgi:uracil phosphoribosyltransferase
MDALNNFEIQMGYTAFGEMSNREVIIIDPMIASGNSLLQAINQVLEIGIPKKIHIAGLIASRDGVNLLKKESKRVKTLFWVCAIDEELNDKSYIVPGLGDAGDLSFGKKL